MFSGIKRILQCFNKIHRNSLLQAAVVAQKASVRLHAEGWTDFSRYIRK